MDIDFVLTWVDGNDPKWQQDKNRYSEDLTKETDTNNSRYRDWDNLQYWFRGVEKYAPWVHKIFFVTYGHYPKWLDLSNPKLEIIRHEDYIPHEWLPTFSSRTIDMNFHRIGQLAEHFVYFNDDMFLIAPVTPKDFFVNGLPCDTAILNALYLGTNPTKVEYMAPIIDTSLINRNFVKKSVMKANRGKWYSLKYGTVCFRSLLLAPWQHFTGFMNFHLPYSYLKSTYAKVWEKEGKRLSETCSHRFRQSADLNHWVFSYWQMVSGDFYPRSPKLGKQVNISGSLRPGSNEEAVRILNDQKYKIVCLNDAVPDEEFDKTQKLINDNLERLFPDKSSFEL